MKYWKISDYYHSVSVNRIRLQRLFFSLALLSLVLDGYYRIMLSQIGPNPVLLQETDPTYLALMYSGLPQFLSGPAAPYFDGLLWLCCVACLVLPRVRIFPPMFFVLHFLYFVTYNMLSGHHYISIGLVIMSIPFIFYDRERFASVFFLARLVFCFMMFSAACWKIVRGNLWYPEQANMLLIQTYARELAGNTTSKMTGIAKWLIRNRAASHAMWCMLIALEGLFVAGFLTFRWDRLLLAAYLVFFVGGWILFNIYNYDNLLFLLTLTPVLHRVERFPSLKSGFRQAKR